MQKGAEAAVPNPGVAWKIIGIAVRGLESRWGPRVRADYSESSWGRGKYLGPFWGGEAKRVGNRWALEKKTAGKVPQVATIEQKESHFDRKIRWRLIGSS